MASNDELDEVLKLVEHLSTWDEIADVLRKHKGDKRIRISADTKEKLVQENVREAVDAKMQKM